MTDYQQALARLESGGGGERDRRDGRNGHGGFGRSNGRGIYRSRARKPQRKGMRFGPTLHLTSMMDVTFLLLIFFIVTASFASDEGSLRADLPIQSTTPAGFDVPVDPLIITLRADDDGDIHIRIGNSPQRYIGVQVFYREVEGLQFDAETNPTGVYERSYPIIIMPLKNVRWASAVDVYNACVKARYENIIFAGERQNEGDGKGGEQQ